MKFGTILKVPVSFDITTYNEDGQEQHSLIDEATLEMELYETSSDNLKALVDDIEKWFKHKICFTVDDKNVQ